MIERSIYDGMWKTLSAEKQMIFLSGPRQAGKTTFALAAAKAFPNSFYFNWDVISHKRMLVENPAFFADMNRKDSSEPLVILDEIHKYGDWKNYLKGIYDEFSGTHKFLVTGSGRLDIRQKGGDSLAGRYFHMHMFPLTLAELCRARRTLTDFLKDPLEGFDLNDEASAAESWRALGSTSGFPEPYAKGSASFWLRWSGNYVKQVVREDVRDAIGVRKAGAMDMLFSLLPTRVSSPVSINNLAGDLRLNFDTVDRWLSLFDSFYLTFRISPWSRKISRAILKEKKLYLYDYPEVVDPAARFENMVAVELQRAVQHWGELGAGRFTLHYVRNKEKAEVDFLIAQGNAPVLLIETKASDEDPAPGLRKFQADLEVPAVQLVDKKGVYRYRKDQRLLIVTASRWLSSLP